jgi:repressor of nif and glnA expression
MENIASQHDKFFKELFSRKNELEIIFENLQHLLETENGRNLFETTIIYLFSNLKNNKEKVTEKLRIISNKGGEIAETIAQKLEKKGKLLGIEETIRKIAINMIKQNFDNETIVKCVDLTISQIELLRDLELVDTNI